MKRRKHIIRRITGTMILTLLAASPFLFLAWAAGEKWWVVPLILIGALSLLGLTFLGLSLRAQAAQLRPEEETENGTKAHH